MNNSEKWWDKEIKTHGKWLYFNFKEIIRFKDLIFLFVKRNFVVFYKQTILGPLWYIIQPVLYSLIFTKGVSIVVTSTISIVSPPIESTAESK